MAKKYVNQTEELIDKLGNNLKNSLDSIGSALWREKGAKVEPKDVNFYDYDGTLVYSYTKKEFGLMTALPANPMHEGLIGQGWNWQFANAKAYVQKYGVCEIGAMFITDDGKTRAVIDIGETERLTATLQFTQSASNVVTVDWGDGTPTETAEEIQASLNHTYAQAGRYTITLEVAEGANYQIGNSGTYTGGFIGMGKHYSGRSILKELYVGANVTTVSGYGLWHQTNLELLTLPLAINTIATRGLEALIHLKALVIPSGVTVMEDYVCRCNYAMEVLCLPDTLKNIKSAFMTCVAVKRVTIPEGVTSIGLSAFQRCFSAVCINVPDTATVIGASAFASCYSLRSLNLPVGLTELNQQVCRQCHNLFGVVIPEGVTKIKEMAFSGCFGVEDLTIPSTVTTIERFAFLYLDGAKHIHVKATTPPVLEPTGFTSTNLVSITVPYSEDHSVLNAYLAAIGWSALGDIISEEPAPTETDTSTDNGDSGTDNGDSSTDNGDSSTDNGDSSTENGGEGA